MQKAWRLLRRRHSVIGMLTVILALGSLLSFRLRGRASLELELIALRHQVTVLRRLRSGRPKLCRADRLLWVWLYRIWPRAFYVMMLVKPATVTNGIAKGSGSIGGGDQGPASRDGPGRRWRPVTGSGR